MKKDDRERRKSGSLIMWIVTRGLSLKLLCCGQKAIKLKFTEYIGRASLATRHKCLSLRKCFVPAKTTGDRKHWWCAQEGPRTSNALHRDKIDLHIIWIGGSGPGSNCISSHVTAHSIHLNGGVAVTQAFRKCPCCFWNGPISSLTLISLLSILDTFLKEANTQN